MKPTEPDKTVDGHRVSRRGWLLRLSLLAVLVWTLPRPWLHDVVVEESSATKTATLSKEEYQSGGRLAFRTARRLLELVPKGSLGEDTELSGPCLANQGQTLYFTRSRPGPRADIYRSNLRNGNWSHPTAMQSLNSVDDDRHLAIGADGSVAILASNRSGGQGGFDLYESSLKDSRWTRPKSVGSVINSDADEFDPAISLDGLRLIFVRVTPGGTADLYRSTRDKIGEDWQAPQPVREVNTATSHERSPTLGRGDVLWFASNREHFGPDATQFDLFRVALFASPPTIKRLSDGIASEADETDPTVSENGDLLVFASKREGVRQLYESRADVVVTRLSWQTDHLERFGRAKLAAPILAVLIFAATWRQTGRRRSTRGGSVPPPSPPKATTEFPTAKRSQSAVNPLANWQTASAVAPPPVERRAVITEPQTSSTDKAKVKVAAKETATPKPVRRQVWKMIVASLLLSGLTFTAKPLKEWLSQSDASRTSDWSALIQFRDISSTKTAELSALTRTRTTRESAPESSASAIEATALRQAARWPMDRWIVRTSQSVDRIPIADPDLASLIRAIVSAKSRVAGLMLSAVQRDAESFTLAGMEPKSEVAHSVVPIIVPRASIEATAAERTQLAAITMSGPTVGSPSRRGMVIDSIATFFGSPVVSTSNGLVRRGLLSSPAAVVESVELKTLPTGTQSEPLLTSSVSRFARGAEAIVGNIPSEMGAASRSIPIERRPSSQASSPLATSDAVGKPAPGVITRQSAASKPHSLVDEPGPLGAVVNLESIGIVKLGVMIRSELAGPLPVLLPVTVGQTSPQSTLAEVRTAIARGAAVVPVERLETTSAKSPKAMEGIVRRDSRSPVVALTTVMSVMAADTSNSPALLLTSAAQLVELLPARVFPAMPKADSAGPATSISVEPLIGLAKWFARGQSVSAPVNASGESVSLPNSKSVPPPRRMATAIPAELREEVVPAN